MVEETPNFQKIGQTMKRRMFLKFLAYLGLAGPLALSSSCGSDNTGASALDVPGDVGDPAQKKVVAYKLSRRGHKSCNACKQHAQHKVFLTQADAEANRAHAGCNCRIKPIGVPGDLHRQYFIKGPVYDSRWQA